MRAFAWLVHPSCWSNGAAFRFLKENPDVLEEVDARVRDSIGLGHDPEVEEASDQPKDEPLKEAAVSGGG